MRFSEHQVLGTEGKRKSEEIDAELAVVQPSARTQSCLSSEAQGQLHDLERWIIRFLGNGVGQGNRMLQAQTWPREREAGTPANVPGALL